MFRSGVVVFVLMRGGEGGGWEEIGDGRRLGMGDGR